MIASQATVAHGSEGSAERRPGDWAWRCAAHERCGGNIGATEQRRPPRAPPSLPAYVQARHEGEGWEGVGRAASAARVDALGGGGAVVDAVTVVSGVVVERVMVVLSRLERVPRILSRADVAIAVQWPQLFDNTPLRPPCAG